MEGDTINLFFFLTKPENFFFTVYSLSPMEERHHYVHAQKKKGKKKNDLEFWICVEMRTRSFRSSQYLGFVPLLI